MNPYIGHPSQLYGVEEHRLVGGKGDHMRLYQIKNGRGLEMTICPDRCLDISRLSFRGVNCGYFAPCGYVAPAYYDDQGNGFLKSFSAGFLTTCGLTTVGTSEAENGVSLPLHGTVGNAPAENACAYTEGDQIIVRGQINQSGIFDHKLMLERKITCALAENSFVIEDCVANQGDGQAPFMLLYHMNMGYPLLSEHARLRIPAADTQPRNAHAAKDIATWHQLLPPTPGFEEQCYLHSFAGNEAQVSIENPQSGIGLGICFDPQSLPSFTEWKMMGVRDYVLGLEPGNCFPVGRVAARQEGSLQFLQPGESRSFRLKVSLYTVE